MLPMNRSSAKHQARKRFGQNFLADQSVISAIEDAIRPRAEEHLVEIGPGLGALTRELLPSGCRLDAIELDRDLAAPLLAAFSIHKNFSLHKADALTFEFSSLVNNECRLRVVGNLPYNISTPLIFRLLDQQEVIQDMHFMLQLEVVQRALLLAEHTQLATRPERKVVRVLQVQKVNTLSSFR